MMIDYLLLFPDDSARTAAYAPEEGNPPGWIENGVFIAPVTIMVSPPVVDAEGIITEQAVFAPGAWLRLRAVSRIPEIENAPNCLLATDNDRAAAGEPYVYFYRFQPDTVLGQISPMFAGDEYAIPTGQPVSVLDSMIIPEVTT